MNIDQALADPNLLGAGLGSDLPSWASWRAILRAAYGLPLDDEQAETFNRLAGGRQAPQSAVSEFWAVWVVRRAGKSRTAAAVAVYKACFAGHEKKLAPGEQGIVAVVSASRWQARAIHGYALGFLRSSPILKQVIRRAGAEEIELNNGISIKIRSGNFRTARGRTLVCAVFDETAYWRSEESANPDLETYRAMLPALATTGGKLWGISSPYRRSGLLWTKHSNHFGEDDPDVLVIQAPSAALNPTLDAAVIERARQSDPEAAIAEWDAQIRGDISGFLTHDAVRRVTDIGIAERLPILGGSTALDRHRTSYNYSAFCDPSGGSADSMTLAVAHIEDDKPLLDLLREIRPPFNPQSVVQEFTATLKRYNLREITGDRFGGAWVSDSFSRQGVRYMHSMKTKNDIYLSFLPLVNAGECRLLDNTWLHNQLTQLERRTSRTGRDSVDHLPGGHDDLANAAAGAIVSAKRAARCRTTTAAVRGLY